jgi:hypothetical protein
MRTMPRRSGRKVKHWWESLFNSLHYKQPTVPGGTE